VCVRQFASSPVTTSSPVVDTVHPLTPYMGALGQAGETGELASINTAVS
jgi:hypothetical protein